MKKILLILAIILCRTIVMADSPNTNKTNVINNLDTIVFDLSKEVINGNNISFPVSFISDDTVTALDFSMKFSLPRLTYDSIANLKSYLSPLGNYNALDSTLYMTSYSLTPIEHNKSLISVYFDVTSGKINKSDLSSILCYLNGDPCTCKIVDYSVGISELGSNDLVSIIYPNPVRDVLTIRMKQFVKDASAGIYDPTGRLMKTEYFSGDTFSISCKDISSGVYFYRINLKAEEGVSGRFLKE